MIVNNTDIRGEGQRGGERTERKKTMRGDGRREKREGRKER